MTFLLPPNKNSIVALMIIAFLAQVWEKQIQPITLLLAYEGPSIRRMPVLAKSNYAELTTKKFFMKKPDYLRHVNLIG